MPTVFRPARALVLLACVALLAPLPGAAPLASAQGAAMFRLFLPAVASTTRAAAPDPLGPAVRVSKRLVEPADGRAGVGDTLRFEVALANAGSTAIDVLPLADTFDPAVLAFAGATVAGASAPPSAQSPGLLRWSDLTQLPGVGNLLPGQSLAVEVRFTALAPTRSGGGWSTVSHSAPAPSQDGGRTPNDYYDLETRYVIDHALDPVNGGIYLATQPNGEPWGPIPEDVYGFGANFLEGTSKHPGGNAQCIVYFYREYQRLLNTGRTIQSQRHGLQRPADMLRWAKDCADFVNAHMIIGRGQNEPNPLPTCTPGENNRCVYYWGFVDATGQREHFYPIPASRATTKYYNLMDSFVAWSMAGLALLLNEVGDPSYVTYRDAARDYWNWAVAVGAPYSPQNPTVDDPSWEGRDQFWAGLGLTLYELSVAEGAPEDALRQEVLDCVNARGAYATSYPLRNRCNGTSYTTAYGRAAAHAMELLHRGVDNYDGGRPVWHDFGSTQYGLDPATPQSPFVPFTHGAGREFVAGAQRAHWFYYTFPDQPAPDDLLGRIEVGGQWNVESWSRAAILGYWDYAVKNMWDDTPGLEAWWESQSQRYKPCFSLGTPVPIADWQAPSIGDKVHTLNPDGSATVTISGTVDPLWPFFNWQFRGIGVEKVEVRYSTDRGQTWQSVTAQETAPGSGTYRATIPPTPGQSVFYYAAAADAFGNAATFPANAPDVYQIYTNENATWNVAWSEGGRDEGGTEVPPDQGEVIITVTTPTAVTLSRFEARRAPGGVDVAWQTGSEQNTYGFRVYRGATPERAGATLASRALIPAQGAGASYHFADAGAPAGPLFYWLEEVELDGGLAQHGPAAVE
jgi:hypothetical protein